MSVSPAPYGPNGAHRPHLPLADLARERGAALRPSERRVVEHLLALDPLDTGATAERVAGVLGVSRATVVNTVQRLGYGGFAEFRRSLILERALEARTSAGVNGAAGATSTNGTPARTLAQRTAAQPHERFAEHPAIAAGREVFEQERTALEDTERLLGEEFQRAVDLLAQASSVLCIGAELSSAVLARLAAGMLTKCGVRAMGEEHASEQRALVEVADARTALLAISYRGMNEHLVQIAALARARGLTVVVITNNPRSPLGRTADVTLVTTGPALLGEPNAQRIGPRGAQLAMARALAEAIAEVRHA